MRNTLGCHKTKVISTDTFLKKFQIEKDCKDILTIGLKVVAWLKKTHNWNNFAHFSSENLCCSAFVFPVRHKTIPRLWLKNLIFPPLCLDFFIPVSLTVLLGLKILCLFAKNIYRNNAGCIIKYVEII